MNEKRRHPQECIQKNKKKKLLIADEDKNLMRKLKFENKYFRKKKLQLINRLTFQGLQSKILTLAFKKYKENLFKTTEAITSQQLMDTRFTK